MIWIIGGTSETRELVRQLESSSYIVTVATYAGVEVLRDYKVIERRMDYEEMVEFIGEFGINKTIDMTHPYALEVSDNGKRACDKAGIPYIRYIREASMSDKVKYLYSWDQVEGYISKLSGTVFFTTGTKDISRFESIKMDARHVYRVLPTEFSIKTCLENKVDMKNIVAMMGPFSKDLNRELFKQYGADYVVMKDSGICGGTREKVDACMELGIKCLVIGRREEDGFSEIDEILEMVR